MLLVLSSIIILQFNTFPVKANYLRTNDVKDVDEHRKLNWEMLVPGYTNVTNDLWYSDYDAQEIPLNGSSYWEDKPDKFRNGDLCYKDGSYSRSNCPTELDCSHLNKNVIGPAKLCINRAPTTTGMWYVLLQKCVPNWENCDKCLCGTMTSAGSTGVCVYNPECEQDDDRIKLDCSNPSQVTVLGDYTFNSGTGIGFIGVGSLQLETIGVDPSAVVEKVNHPPEDTLGGAAATQEEGASKGSKGGGEQAVAEEEGASKGSKGGGEQAAAPEDGAKGADGATKGRRRRVQKKML